MQFEIRRFPLCFRFVSAFFSFRLLLSAFSAHSHRHSPPLTPSNSQFTNFPTFNTFIHSQQLNNSTTQQLTNPPQPPNNNKGRKQQSKKWRRQQTTEPMFASNHSLIHSLTRPQISQAHSDRHARVVSTRVSTRVSRVQRANKTRPLTHSLRSLTHSVHAALSVIYLLSSHSHSQ